MPTFRILGQVEPHWYHFTFEFSPTVNHRIEEIDLDLTCRIEINQSLVVVNCEANRWDDGIVSWVLGYVSDWVNAEIDVFVFTTGKVFDVRLDRAEYPDGTTKLLIGTAPDLAALATACKVTSVGGKVRGEVRDLLPLIIGQPTLMLALHDLASALRYGNNTLTNCGRAMEGIRKAIWGKDEADSRERQEAWELLRNSLHVSEPYLKRITDASRDARHGSSAYIPGATRQEVLTKSWKVMNRYLLYRLRGDKELPANEHPTL
jgi:hypothetical protein